MPARRCSIGCESWPDEDLFIRCTICGEATTRISNAQPTIDREAAVSAKLHELFDAFYERRCDKLGIPAEGPLPEPGPMDLETLGPAPPRRRD